MKFNVNEAPEEGKPDFPKFELQRDEVARVNLLSTQGWEVIVRHWVTGIGYVRCHAMDNATSTLDLLKIQEEGGRPEECLMCRMAADGNENVRLPRRQFAARILRYKTDLQGRNDSSALQYWMEIWLFDNRKYRNIRDILAEWGQDGKIRDHDLAITCTDEKWQNMTIQPLRNALWMDDKDNVAAYFKDQIEKYDLGECLAQVIEPEALERRFAHIQRRTRVEEPPNLGSDVLPTLGTSPEPLGAAKSDAGESDPFDLGGGGGELPKVEEEKPADPQTETTGGGDFLDDLLSGKAE